MSIVKLNGVDFDVDFLDLAAVEKIEQGYENLLAKLNIFKDDKWMKQSEMIRQGCDLVYTYFDDSLGEGASEKIFHGDYNFGTALKVVGDFAIAKQNSGNDITAITSQYSEMLNKDKGNREQRRNQNKNKNKNNNRKNYTPNNKR